MKYIILTIVIFFIGIQLSMPQENLPTNIDNVLDSTYTKLQLPPLQVFLNAVYNNASVQIRKEITEEEKSTLRAEKKNWLNYFSIRGIYQYGVTSGNISQSDTDSPLFYTYTGTNQHLYNIGINMNIPLDDLFNRKSKVNEKKSKVKQAEFAYEQAVEERKLRILEAYNSVLEHLTLLKVKSEAVALYNAQMKISEADFIKGKISIIDLSLERGRRTTAVVNFQETKAALHNSITLLEMLTGVKIIK